MMGWTWARWGAVSMAMVILTGAFGAHGLKSRLEPEAIEWWKTAVQYQAWHSLGLFAVHFMARPTPNRPLQLSGFLFLLGIVLFSGSLYVMSLTQFRVLGAVTPIGGLSWVVGWILLAVASTRQDVQSSS